MYTYTNQIEIRAAFNAEYPRSETPTTRRCQFVDFIDYLQRAGQISDALAQRATLEPSKKPSKPRVKPEFIEVRRWFDKTYGNTYHSLKIHYSDGSADVIGMTYGCNDQYKQTAVEHIRAKFPARYKHLKNHSAAQFLNALKIRCTVSDGLKRGLFKS